MSNPASEGLLGLLHEMVAQGLITDVQGEELKDEDGNVIGRARPNPAVYNAAIKFLKDNNIQSTREGSKALSDLAEQVQKAAPVADADDLELQLALDNVMQFPGSVAHA